MIDRELRLALLDCARKVRGSVSVKFFGSLPCMEVTSGILVRFTAGGVIGTVMKFFSEMFGCWVGMDVLGDVEQVYR